MGSPSMLSVTACLNFLDFTLAQRRWILQGREEALGRPCLLLWYFNCTIWCCFHSIHFSLDPEYKWYVHWHRALFLAQIALLIRFRKRIRAELAYSLWPLDNDLAPVLPAAAA